jgi:hypothetical protein
MANKKSDEFIAALAVRAVEYIDECLANTKQHATHGGKVVDVQDRHIPTIEFFLRIWMPRNHGESISPVTYYEWLKREPTNDDSDEVVLELKIKTNTIKKINDEFKALATDIVANEGKGIFYAKNRLGMTDRQQTDVTANVSFLSIDPIKSDDNE